MLSAGILLLSFAANQYGFMSRESLWYDVANLLAGIGLLAYAWWLGSVPFVLINAVWAAVSGVDVVRDLLRLKKGGK